MALDRAEFKPWAQYLLIQVRQVLLVANNQFNLRRFIMWTKPEVTEMRFGFEVTMYVCNR